jgi:hypothetical protein
MTEKEKATGFARDKDQIVKTKLNPSKVALTFECKM